MLENDLDHSGKVLGKFDCSVLIVIIIVTDSRRQIFDLMIVKITIFS
jgi:hypothetical protein